MPPPIAPDTASPGRSARTASTWFSAYSGTCSVTPPSVAVLLDRFGSAGAVDATVADVVEIGDRREAIAHAVRWARSGDVVLIAGKGHETGQTAAGRTHPFDDRVELVELLEKRG